MTKFIAFVGTLFLAVVPPAYSELEKGALEQILPERDDQMALSFSADPSAKVFEQALADQNQGKLADSISGYKKVLAQYPKCLPASYNLGLCFEKLKQWDDALLAFESVSEINPFNESVYRHLIFVARKAGKNREARIFYFHYLKL